MKIFVGEHRREQGLTIAELSSMSGVAGSHIHNIEAGIKVPTITTLCKLSKALEVPCWELYTCED